MFVILDKTNNNIYEPKDKVHRRNYKEIQWVPWIQYRWHFHLTDSQSLKKTELPCQCFFFFLCWENFYHNKTGLYFIYS